MSDRDKVILVGEASVAAYADRLLKEYRADESRVVITDRPAMPDLLGLDLGNRKQRRSYSSKKLRLKGLRP
jgi:hypothetical protein